MTNMEILGKAIMKAGRKSFRYKEKYSFNPWDYHMKEIIIGLVPYEPLIFSHDFAKAFWGEERIANDGSNYNDYLRCSLEAGMTEEEAKEDWEIDEECFTIPKWQYHLQRMVLQEEPLKYLEDFL